jgi:hypothetical protein
LTGLNRLWALSLISPQAAVGLHSSAPAVSLYHLRKPGVRVQSQERTSVRNPAAPALDSTRTACVRDLSGKAARMRWYHYISYFFGGIFLANALPHLGNGISGHAFQSPFASPPGVGLSSSVVNVAWGSLQPCRRLLAGVSCGSLRSAQDPARSRSRGRHPGHVAKSCPLFRSASRRAVKIPLVLSCQDSPARNSAAPASDRIRILPPRAHGRLR